MQKGGGLLQPSNSSSPRWRLRSRAWRARGGGERLGEGKLYVFLMKRRRIHGFLAYTVDKEVVIDGGGQHGGDSEVNLNEFRVIEMRDGEMKTLRVPVGKEKVRGALASCMAVAQRPTVASMWMLVDLRGGGVSWRCALGGRVQDEDGAHPVLLGGGAWNGGVELELELWQWRPELWRGESRGARLRASEEKCAVREGEALSPLEGAGLGSGQRPASLAVCVSVDGRELLHSIGEKKRGAGE